MRSYRWGGDWGSCESFHREYHSWMREQRCCCCCCCCYLHWLTRPLTSFSLYFPNAMTRHRSWHLLPLHCVVTSAMWHADFPSLLESVPSTHPTAIPSKWLRSQSVFRREWDDSEAEIRYSNASQRKVNNLLLWEKRANDIAFGVLNEDQGALQHNALTLSTDGILSKNDSCEQRSLERKSEREKGIERKRGRKIKREEDSTSFHRRLRESFTAKERERRRRRGGGESKRKRGSDSSNVSSILMRASAFSASFFFSFKYSVILAIPFTAALKSSKSGWLCPPKGERKRMKYKTSESGNERMFVKWRKIPLLCCAANQWGGEYIGEAAESALSTTTTNPIHCNLSTENGR